MTGDIRRKREFFPVLRCYLRMVPPMCTTVKRAYTGAMTVRKRILLAGASRTEFYFYLLNFLSFMGGVEERKKSENGNDEIQIKSD